MYIEIISCVETRQRMLPINPNFPDYVISIVMLVNAGDNDLIYPNVKKW